MDARDQSAALIRRGAELRDQSMRIRGAAAETVESGRQLIAAAAAQEAVMHTRGEERAGRTGRAPRMGCPRAGSTAGPVACRVRPVAS